jgi:hypothetical protein
MNIRRPAAGLLVAFAVAFGGSLSACSDPVNAGTGTPHDHARNLSGNDPSGVSQGNVPNLSDSKESDRGTESGGA